MLALSMFAGCGGDDTGGPGNQAPAQPPPGFTHQYTTVNGIRTHYVTGGSGPALVLLHGYPESWYEWRGIMPALGAHYTVIAPDLRGLGDTDKPQSGYDMGAIADDVYQLTQQLALSEINLVGHDWGGGVAYAYAATHPAQVRRLAIMEAVPAGFGLEELFNSNPDVFWFVPFNKLANLPEDLVAGKEREYLQVLYSIAQGKITPDAVDEYVRVYSQPGGMHAGAEYYRNIPKDAQENQALAQNKLSMPVLAVGGEHSMANLPADKLAPLATQVRGVVVPKVSHFLAEEDPQGVTNLVLDFLAP
jgi:pimeloyl-ACP methyl ester carboxylesterase